MRHLTRAFLLLCGIAAVDATAARLCHAQFFMGGIGDSIPRISAMGRVTIPIAPDRAVVYASVAGRDSSGAGALAQASATRDRATTALSRLGVQVAPWGFALGREDGPGMRPRPETAPGMNTTARWGVRVVVERIDQLDAVLRALTGAGIEGTPHVSLEADGAADVRRRATEQAVAEARREAEAMARAAGGRLGDLVNLTNMSELGASLSGDTRFFFGQGFERGATLSPSDARIRVAVQGVWRFHGN
ncbi:MAG TPA: SIMPL domain-containing protein [Longimicrobium sp.]|jgi:hypothetical protein